MARPRAEDGIRARRRSYDGVIEIHLEEYPRHWILTSPPVKERDKAIKWAKRNRATLIHRKTDTFGAYCEEQLLSLLNHAGRVRLTRWLRAGYSPTSGFLRERP
jgi:hypothetical protein